MANKRTAKAAKNNQAGRTPLASILLIWVFLLFVVAVGSVIGWLWWIDQTGADGAPATPAGVPQPAPGSADGKAGKAEPGTAAQSPAVPPQSVQSQSTHEPADKSTDKRAQKPARKPADKAARDTDPSPVKPAAPPQVPQRTAPPPLPIPKNGNALAPAPAAGLAAEGKYGLLPVVSPEGKRPWKTYRRPYKGAPTQPRIAIVMYDLGLAEPQTLAAIQDLPADITLSFNPYGSRVDEWTLQARAAGHEVLLQIPMEPVNTSNDDPGPRAIISTLTAEQRKDRLDWILSRAVGYVGVTNFMGDQMTAQQSHIRPVMEMLAPRGLIYIDARTTQATLAHKIARSQGIPAGLSTRFIDKPLVAREAIDAALSGLEREARARGRVIAFARPFPVTIERLRYWATGLKKRNIDLAPVSAAITTR